MNKLLRIIFLGLLMMSIATVVSAGEPKAAIVIHDDWCLIPDARGMDYLWYIEECLIMVDTNSKNDTKILSGQAYLPPEAEEYIPARTMRFNYKNTGFECWWDENTTTTKYQFTLTPTGRVNFYCVFKN